jgi:chromosome segregation ATPase
LAIKSNLDTETSNSQKLSKKIEKLETNYSNLKSDCDKRIEVLTK